jgi:hypothetical protein
MSMQNDDNELEPEHQNLSPDVQALLRQGRKAQRDLEAATTATKQLEKSVAIERAGVPNHPARDVVFEKYDGPLESDAIKAYAEKFGIIAVQPVSSGPTDQEISAQRQILQAGGGAPAANGDVDLAVALRNAKSPGEIMAIVQQMSGDPGFRNHDGLIGVMPEV